MNVALLLQRHIHVRRSAAVCRIAAASNVRRTTGSLNGRVADATGVVLPGVTVTATSPALQGVRTTISNEEGTYRIPGVPPGVYTVYYELCGFGTIIREGINISVGVTATVNVELKVASLQETATVSGASPVVDISSTSIGPRGRPI